MQNEASQLPVVLVDTPVTPRQQTEAERGFSAACGVEEANTYDDGEYLCVQDAARTEVLFTRREAVRMYIRFCLEMGK